MNNKEQLQKKMTMEQLPLSAKYDIEWLVENEMGPCSVWLTEFLTQAMKLKPGMRVLDMGCGKAMSSIFLAKEFGVQVWANDLWIKPTDNWERIKAAGISDQICPIHAEAHALPYAQGFFDAIISTDSYHYYGTDERYLQYFIQFLKPGGQIGMLAPGVRNEMDLSILEKLKPHWDPDIFTFHSPEWWELHWQKSGVVDVETADALPNGYEIWLKWDKTLKEEGVLQRSGDVEMLEADGGNFTFTRIVARRK